MKRLIAIIVCLAASASAAYAQDQGVGLGVMAGEPTGVTFKTWLDDRSAIDAAAGWSFEGRSSFYLHGDWLFHDFNLIEVERGAMPLYAGLGGRYKHRSGRSDRLGLRVPVGLAYHFDDLPLEAFGELGPVLDVTPSTSLRITGGVGLRWYFD